MIIGDNGQAEFAKAKSLVDSIERLCSCFSLGQVTSFPPLFGFPHALQTAERSPKRCVVKRTPEFEGLFEKAILLIVHSKRELDDVGWSSGSHGVNSTSDSKS